jgi:hypothetical protein
MMWARVLEVPGGLLSSSPFPTRVPRFPLHVPAAAAEAAAAPVAAGPSRAHGSLLPQPPPLPWLVVLVRLVQFPELVPFAGLGGGSACVSGRGCDGSGHLGHGGHPEPLLVAVLEDELPGIVRDADFPEGDVLLPVCGCCRGPCFDRVVPAHRDTGPCVCDGCFSAPPPLFPVWVPCRHSPCAPHACL